MIQITKTIEWHMGHRIPNHDGQCRYPHGHSYRLELTLSGPLVKEQGAPDEGMIVDFSLVSQALKTHVKDLLDHRFVAYDQDPLLKKAFAGDLGEELKIFFVPFIPTSENLVKWCYLQLKDVFPPKINVVKLRLYETSKSWSDYVL